MNTEELKLNDKELHKCIDELKGTQFLSAFYILDWIIKMRNENEELQERINKAIEYIRSEYTITDDDVYLALYSSNGTLDKLEEILKGEENVKN